MAFQVGQDNSCWKIGILFQKQEKSFSGSLYIYRPAAIKQLQVVGEKAETPVFEYGKNDPVLIAREALKFAKNNNHDIVLIDTAGRLHINEELMES